MIGKLVFFVCLWKTLEAMSDRKGNFLNRTGTSWKIVKNTEKIY